MPEPYKIGLTGGIGSGKSTVTRAFSQLGVPTFSADAISHELSRKNQPGYLKIIAAFGDVVLQADGELDRKALGDAIFSNKQQKLQLESILHPMIMRTMHQRAHAVSASYCVLDIPLLINTAERGRVDRVLVVHCEQKERVARIQKRNGWSLEKISRIMENQVSEQSLLNAADDVINNSGDMESIEDQVATLHEAYLRLSGP